MDIFKRIFGRKSAMCICGERPAIEALTLPNGKKVNVCSECKKEIEEFIARPIDSSQFEEILNRIYVSKIAIWNMPWDATREEVISNFPLKISEQLKSSKSSNLMSYFASIAGQTVEITFYFDEKGLCEVIISPHGCLLDIRGPLIKSYGIPSDKYEMPSLSSKEPNNRIIWEKDGYEIEVDYTVYGFASISFIRQRSGYNFSESYQSLLEKDRVKPINTGTTIKCSVCGEDIKLPTYHRENIYTGEKQYFCKKCWINSVPLGRIYSLSKKQRKQRISQMNHGEKEAYDILMQRYYIMKYAKWALLVIVLIGAFVLIRTCF